MDEFFVILCGRVLLKTSALISGWELPMVLHELASLVATLGAVCRSNGHLGESRDHWRAFKFSHRRAHHGDLVICLDDRLRHHQASGDLGFQRADLAFSNAIGSRHRAVVVVLFPCAATRRGLAGRPSGQAKRGVCDRAGSDFSQRKNDVTTLAGWAVDRVWRSGAGMEKRQGVRSGLPHGFKFQVVAKVSFPARQVRASTTCQPPLSALPTALARSPDGGKIW